MAYAEIDIERPALEHASASMPPFDRKRWLIAMMLLFASMLNYIDRSTLGLLEPTIRDDLHLTSNQYAHIVDGFLVAYTFANLLSGRVVDQFGSRKSLTLFVGFWSLATALTGIAKSAFSLGTYRSLLGLGEAGAYTASPKAVSEWFPPAERALAVGMYSMGTSIGATIAPLLVIGLAESPKLGWRGAFLVTGLLGFAWLIPWWILSARPVPVESPTESSESTAASIAPRDSEMARWKKVFQQPAVWRLTLARLLTDSVWYFYLFWMPKYLHDIRGVSQEGLRITWVMYLAAAVGFLAGGFLSDRLVRRGVNAAAGRVWLLLVAALLMPLSPGVGLGPTVAISLAFASVIVLAHCAWLGNLSSLVIDVVPENIMATTFGVVAAGSAIGGIAMNELVAWVIPRYSYNACFLAMAFLHPLALLLIWPLRRFDKLKTT